jgi:hypothetical protein
MKTRFFILLISLPAFLFSQGSSRGVVSLKLPITPISASTGESFVADPAAFQSLGLNPANLASHKSYGVMFSHTEWFQDTRTELLSLAAPLKLGTIAFSIANTSVDGIEVREVPGPALGTFNYQSASFQILYAVEISQSICIGIAPKYLYEKIYVDEATGYSIDAGILYQPSLNGIILGCSLTGLGSLGAFHFEQTDLPSQIRLGGTYSFLIQEFSFRTALAFSSELGTSLHHLHLGGEATYDNTMTLRFGYATGYDIRGFSAGIGIRYNIAVVDYAYIPFSLQTGNAHIISIGFIL